MSLELLKAAALELPAPQRAELARRLLESLDPEADESPAIIEAAWDEEIRRRLDEYDTGGVKTIAAKTVFAELRDRPA